MTPDDVDFYGWCLVALTWFGMAIWLIATAR